jgi:hypothetical protein
MRQEIQVFRHVEQGGPLRLTPKQQQLVEHLKQKGKRKRGRWVRAFPPGTKTVTVSSLLSRGLIEERFVSIPQHKWPKNAPPMTAGYSYQELRLRK